MKKFVTHTLLAAAVVGFSTTAKAEKTVNVGGLVKASYSGMHEGSDPWFGVDHARLTVWGMAADSVAYKLQIDPVMANTVGLAVADAYASFILNDMLTVSLGNSKRPVGAEWNTDAAELDFWKTTVAQGKLVRSVGLWLDATPMEMVSIRLGVYNSAAGIAASADKMPAFGARVNVMPMEGLSIGASTVFDRNDATDKNQIQLGVAVGYAMNALEVALEFLYENNPASGVGSIVAAAATKAWDGHLSVLYTALDVHQLGVRYELYRPNQDVDAMWHLIDAQYAYLFGANTKATVMLGYEHATSGGRAGNFASGADKNGIKYGLGLQAAF